MYYSTRFTEAEGDIKKTWRLINSVMKDNTSENRKINEIRYNNKTITHPAEIANRFNDFFVNIGPDLDKKKSQD
jgi:hypothetical protein